MDPRWKMALALAAGAAAPVAAYALTPKGREDSLLGPDFGKQVALQVVGTLGTTLLLGYGLGARSGPALLGAAGLFFSSMAYRHHLKEEATRKQMTAALVGPFFPPPAPGVPFERAVLFPSLVVGDELLLDPIVANLPEPLHSAKDGLHTVVDFVLSDRTVVSVQLKDPRFPAGKIGTVPRAAILRVLPKPPPDVVKV